MENRKLGRTGLDVGVIGLGTEHLERKRETLDAVLHNATDAGVNYVDLLYVEEDYWEEFGDVYRAYRDRLVVAAHWASGPCCDLGFCQRTFDNILASLGNDYAEVALMTMIDEKDRQGEWLEKSLEHLRRYQEQGRVGYVGGSAHDVDQATRAVESGVLDVLMFPVNMLGHDDEKNQALYRACVEQGTGLVAMKPYHGGRLFSARGKPSGITPAQCLSYVFSLSVSAAVPGPKTVAELEGTLRYLEASAGERDHGPVVASLHDRMAGQCVYCHHCLPCPEGIEVGWVLWMVDHAQDGVSDDLRGWYSSFPVKASACTGCGVCVERCPFEVDVISRIREAVGLFE